MNRDPARLNNASGKANVLVARSIVSSSSNDLRSRTWTP